VCSQLGIVEEDYFGLQYTGGKGEALWLNNRNRIDKQLSGHSLPYRFQLRVKFYVQPHLLLQDTSRWVIKLHENGYIILIYFRYTLACHIQKYTFVLSRMTDCMSLLW